MCSCNLLTLICIVWKDLLHYINTYYHGFNTSYESDLFHKMYMNISSRYLSDRKQVTNIMDKLYDKAMFNVFIVLFQT